MPRKTSVKDHTAPARARADVADDLRERILIRLLTAISRACRIFGTRSISHLGMSTSQAAVLGELFRHDGCRQEDLRLIVALDKGNVTRALQRLEGNGLVVRKQDPADRRAVRVYVTEKAVAIRTEMRALATHWDDGLTAGFSHEKREMLVDLLLSVEVNARAMARREEAREAHRPA